MGSSGSRDRWLLTLAIPVDFGQKAGLTPSLLSTLYQTGAFFVWSASFGIILLVVSAWLILRPGSSANPANGFFGKWEWLALAAPPAAVWITYLLAFWPAVMSVDSVNQWTQLQTGNYNNWHPVFHTLTQWALTRFIESPAMVAATQIAVLSGVVGWALASMRRIGLPTGAAWLISGAVALFPANAITVITLWKDIPYAITVLALSVIILREVDGRNSFIDKRRGWVLIVGVAALMSLYHHAGLMVSIGSLGILWLAKRQQAIIGVALMALIVVAVIQGGLYRAIGVSGTEHTGITGAVTHHIAAHLVNGTELTAQEHSKMTELIPIAGSSWYDCELINSMVLNPNFDVNSMHELAADTRSLWWSLFTRDPGVDLAHLACKSHVVWHIRQVPGGHHYVTQLMRRADGVSTIVKNDFGLELDPIVSSLTGPLADVIIKTQRPLVSWFFWRGALFLYVLIFGAAVAAVRGRDWRYWAVVAPPVLVAVTLVLAAPAQDYRYMYPVVLSGMILGPYLLFGVARGEPDAVIDPTPLHGDSVVSRDVQSG